MQLDVFRQIQVTDPKTGARAVVDLGFDARDHPPVRLDVGPVLALEDAVVSKVRRLIDREAARDFIDVHELLARGTSPLSNLSNSRAEAVRRSWLTPERRAEEDRQRQARLERARKE
jgi:predicted nucleotidyltransferase component of viral defense system